MVMSLLNPPVPASLTSEILACQLCGMCLADDDDNEGQGEVEAVMLVVMLCAAARNHVP